MVRTTLRCSRFALLTVGILCIISSVSAFAADDSRGADIVECAIETIGQRETHGNNRSPFIDECLRLTKVGLGNPWCAAVGAMWHFMADVPNPMSAYSPTWFPEKECIYIRGKKNDDIVRPGDCGGIYIASKKRIGHWVLVESSDQKWVNTIEGNTNEGGSDEGDRVMRRKRLLKNIERISRYWDNE